MTPKEVESVYVRACHKRRLRPNQEEGQEWYRQLKGFERADVEQAVAEWDANGTLDLRGQPKSKWLPSAIELTNLTAAVAERRLKSATGPWIFSTGNAKGRSCIDGSHTSGGL